MSASLTASPSRTTPSFAGTLADMAAPERKFPPARALDGMEDDVAILSYEQALRSRFRWRPVDPDLVELQDKSGPATPHVEDPNRNTSRPDAAKLTEEQTVKARRASSVTIRLSAEENARLHDRAQEAGLTVSAYLRSCAFEVESLRAQVKSTLSQLRARADEVGPDRSAASEASESRRGWCARLARFVRRHRTSPR